MSSDSIPQFKTCTKCGQSKPLDEFYFSSKEKNYRLSHCKACMKAASKAQVRLPEGVTSVETEAAVIRELAKVGIPARPGRDLSVKWVDVVAWGICNVEVKSSKLHDNGFYVFALTYRQKQHGIRGDVVVLVCRNDDGDTYHVFPADHPAFFMDGERKHRIVYGVNRKRQNSTRNGKPITHLTAELMAQHQDAWHLIEDVRIAKSDALKRGA